MAQPVIKMDFRKEIKRKYDSSGNKLKNIQYFDHLELLECGHQNNLLLDNRSTGICPKGDTKDSKGVITRG